MYKTKNGVRVWHVLHTYVRVHAGECGVCAVCAHVYVVMCGLCVCACVYNVDLVDTTAICDAYLSAEERERRTQNSSRKWKPTKR